MPATLSPTASTKKAARTALSDTFAGVRKRLLQVFNAPTDAEALGRFWADPYAFTPPQGEPVLAFSERVLGAVERLHQRHAGERVLLVSHGGVMRLLLARARGLPREQLLNVEVAHGALFALTVEAGQVLSEGV